MFFIKIIKFICESYFKVLNTINKLLINLFGYNIIFGKNVLLHKNVNIKTFDNGKIFIKENVIIESNCQIISQYNTLIIGENTYIGEGTIIVAMEDMEIGNNATIESYCVIRDQNHGISKSKKISLQEMIRKKISIGDDVLICSKSTITAGSHLCQGVIITPNSVVTSTIKEFTIAGGVPAKFIKRRDE